MGLPSWGLERLGLWRGGVIDLFGRKRQLECAQMAPSGVSLKAKLMETFEKSSSDLYSL